MDVEHGIIGCLLMDNSVIDIAGPIYPAMFTDETLRKAYQIIKARADDGETTDMMVLGSMMANVPGILPLIADCVGMVSSAVQIKSYAEALRKEYRTRMTSDMIREFQSADGDIDDKIRALVRKLEKVEPGSGSGLTNSEAVKAFKGKRFTKDVKQGVNTGFFELDKILNGIDDGDVCIVAARPSVGKSAFSTAVALNMARDGHRVALFNLEMTNGQVYDRMISMLGGLPLSRVRRGVAFIGNEQQKFETANKTLENLKGAISFHDDLYKVSEMGAEMKNFKADVAVIDYAQLIRPESNYKGNRYAEVGAISHEIKRTASKLQIPVILLAQLNRASEMTKTKEPTMGELRESGDFEQDASQIILLWNTTEDRDVKGVKVDKNRNGSVGKIEMHFNGDTMTFSSGDDEVPFEDMM